MFYQPPLTIAGACLVLCGILVVLILYAIVAGEDAKYEATATDELWARDLEYYRPKHQKGADDESPDTLEGRAVSVMSRRAPERYTVH